jgi:hypothetical protein
MTIDADRSLALDLAMLDLDEPSALVGFLATHAIGVARRLYCMPVPRPGETETILDAARTAFVRREPEKFGFETSTALFDPFIRGHVLFARLLPHATLRAEGFAESLAVPNWAYFEDSLAFAHFLWSDLEHLVEGLFGRPAPGPDHYGIPFRYEPQRNDQGLGELRQAQVLVRAALQPPTDPDDPAYHRRRIGLRAMDHTTAFAIDEILRAQVHQRLVWFVSVDMVFPIGHVETDAAGRTYLVPDLGDEPLEITDDHGVFPTVIAETIAGVVALDLVGTFWREREVGQCGACGRWMLLSGQQAARVEKGGSAYHDSCRDEHRLAYFRQHSKARYHAIHTAAHVVRDVNEG